MAKRLLTLNSPILFLIFNRPDTTKLVFQEIRKAKPPKLYIAADGPRPNRQGEAERCAETRAIVFENIDWDCSVYTNFKDENLGCKHAVSSAIDWFFEREEEGIVLEDDCLPDQSFFPYCNELLERYRHDNRVMQICGTNVINGWDRCNTSYYFSAYGPIWGWASWRRAWKYYDVDMTLWPMVRENEIFDYCISPEEVNVRKRLYDLVYKGKISTWDYQWGFAKLINSGLSITPSVNLVSNIGFGVDATHAVSGGSLENIPLQALNFPIKHPCWVLRDNEADMIFFQKYMREKTKLEHFRERLLNFFRKDSK